MIFIVYFPTVRNCCCWLWWQKCYYIYHIGRIEFGVVYRPERVPVIQFRCGRHTAPGSQPDLHAHHVGYRDNPGPGICHQHRHHEGKSKFTNWVCWDMMVDPLSWHLQLCIKTIDDTHGGCLVADGSSRVVTVTATDASGGFGGCGDYHSVSQNLPLYLSLICTWIWGAVLCINVSCCIFSNEI